MMGGGNSYGLLLQHLLLLMLKVAGICVMYKIPVKLLNMSQGANLEINFGCSSVGWHLICLRFLITFIVPFDRIYDWHT